MIVEDLDAFVSDFAEVATIGSTAVAGIFDRAYYGADTGSTRAESAQPVFTCQESALPAGYRTAAVVIRGVTYGVAEVHPDGTGMTTLILEK